MLLLPLSFGIMVKHDTSQILFVFLPFLDRNRWLTTLNYLKRHINTTDNGCIIKSCANVSLFGSISDWNRFCAYQYTRCLIWNPIQVNCVTLSMMVIVDPILWCPVAKIINQFMENMINTIKVMITVFIISNKPFMLTVRKNNI